MAADRAASTLYGRQNGAGFGAVLAPSFADIFYANSLKNGLVPVPLQLEAIGDLFSLVERQPKTEITVDLVEQTVEAKHAFTRV